MNYIFLFLTTVITIAWSCLTFFLYDPSIQLYVKALFFWNYGTFHQRFKCVDELLEVQWVSAHEQLGRVGGHLPVLVQLQTRRQRALHLQVCVDVAGASMRPLSPHWFVIPGPERRKKALYTNFQRTSLISFKLTV